MIRDFKIFGGRYIVRAMLILFVTMFAFFAVFSALSFANSMNGESSITEEAPSETEDEEEDDIILFGGSLIFIIAYLCCTEAVSTLSNSCYKTEGSKWTRTVKNSKQRFINAYYVAFALGLIAAVLAGSIIFLILTLIGGEPDIAQYCFMTFSGALISDGVCVLFMFIKNKDVRTVMPIIAFIVIIIATEVLLLINMRIATIIIVCTALALCIFSNIIFRLRYDKIWNME